MATFGVGTNRKGSSMTSETDRDDDDVLRLRAAIRRLPPGQKVKFQCFNKAEADAIEARLTPDERARVAFTWMRFHEI
jgi:hypothetical protein